MKIKKIFFRFILVVVIIFFSSGSLYAQNGKENSSPINKPFDHKIILSVSGGYQLYFDPIVALFGRQAFFVGGAIYGRVYDWIYVGGEISYARSGSDKYLPGSVIEFIPIELNVKYLLWLHENFALDFGIGPSYSLMFFNSNNADKELTHLAGGQAIIGFVFKIDGFMVEQVNKFYGVMNYRDSTMNMSNFKTGIQLGAMF